MGLAIATTSFECTIDDGLAHIVLNQPDRGNPIDGDFCHEFNLCMAELSERDDVRAVLISARGRLFSVGGDLGALASRGAALPMTIKSWTADLHAAIVRMVRMRAPVVMAVQGNVAGGSVSLMAAGDLVVIGKVGAHFVRVCQDRLHAGQWLDDDRDAAHRGRARQAVLPAGGNDGCRHRAGGRTGRLCRER